MGMVKEKLEAFGLKKILSYLDSNPNENIPKIIDWMEKFDKDNLYSTPYRLAREALADPDNNWNILLNRFYTDIDDDVRKLLFENFCNSLYLRNQRRKYYEEKYDCNIRHCC